MDRYMHRFYQRKGEKMKILIADDEIEIRKVLRLLLENSGYEIVEAADGMAAYECVKADGRIDLCIMDIMMPVLDGIEATKKIREVSTLPVLFLTAKSLESDKEAAYSGGGDDYLVKPFSSRELLMKVEALTRRYRNYGVSPKSESEIQLLSDVVISLERREVTKKGKPLDVRDKEFDMLVFLAKNRGRVVSPAELYEAVWGEMPLPSSNNTITVHILGLRRTLEDNPSSPKIIRTVWGKGYQID
jgi:DNA-binding response OmpR family regulator